MPRANDVVTALARKRSIFIGLLAIVIFAGGILYQQQYDANRVHIKNHSFSKEVADTDESRALGLSGRNTIASDVAMVFVFDDQDMRCFWMKDMKFSIDIVWLNADRKVVAIEPAIAPDSYPTNYCHDDTQYVVELHAGTTHKLGLKPGDALTL